jgi:host factor-I protein
VGRRKAVPGKDGKKMTVKQNLQDVFLNEARKKGVMLTIFLVNGFQMKGIVTGFDSFTVTLDSDGKQQLIYKHAISTIAPSRRLEISDEYEERETVTV